MSDKDSRQLVTDLLDGTPAFANVESHLHSLVTRGAKQRAIIGGGAPLVAGAGPGAGTAAAPQQHDLQPETKALLETGARAVTKVQQNGPDVPLTSNEMQGLEAIVLVLGRPAILIQHGDYLAQPEPWDILEPEHAHLKQKFPSVGRIEISQDGLLPQEIGTGFLVAPDVVMTNRHVAKAILDLNGGSFRNGLTPQIDFLRESGNPGKAVFALTEIIGIHDDDAIDLALLRVSSDSPEGVPLPPPITLAADPPDTSKKRVVYVVGYPATDNGGVTPPAVLRDIFGDIVRVKRLAPGMLMKMENDKQFDHDCSTLGGNSGSCVVDLDKDLVIGLHFQGVFKQANTAVALWELKKDDLLLQANVNFEK